MKLIIIRGIPGSGKTTLACKLKEELWKETYLVAHLEADMYFEVMDVLTGHWQYRFDPSRLSEAHKTCLLETEVSLKDGDNVIISNTFTRISEMQPYLKLADSYQAEIEIYEMSNEPVLEKTQKSIHNIPDSVIDKMVNRWEELPSNLIPFKKLTSKNIS